MSPSWAGETRAKRVGGWQAQDPGCPSHQGGEEWLKNGSRLKNGFFGGGKDNRTPRSALTEVEARTGGCPSLSRGEAECASAQSLGRQWTLLPRPSRPQVASLHRGSDPPWGHFLCEAFPGYSCLPPPPVLGPSSPRTPLLQGSECNRRPEPRPLLTLPPSVRAQCRANFPGSQGPAPGCIPGPCVREAFCELLQVRPAHRMRALGSDGHGLQPRHPLSLLCGHSQC